MAEEEDRDGWRTANHRGRSSHRGGYSGGRKSQAYISQRPGERRSDPLRKEEPCNNPEGTWSYNGKTLLHDANNGQWRLDTCQLNDKTTSHWEHELKKLQIDPTPILLRSARMGKEQRAHRDVNFYAREEGTNFKDFFLSKPMVPIVDEMLTTINQQLDQNFNACAINLLQHGSHSLAPHTTDSFLLGKREETLWLLFGQTRIVRLFEPAGSDANGGYKVPTQVIQDVFFQHGAFLSMKGRMFQQDVVCSVPPSWKVDKPSYLLMFYCMQPKPPKSQGIFAQPPEPLQAKQADPTAKALLQDAWEEEKMEQTNVGNTESMSLESSPLKESMDPCHDPLTDTKEKDGGVKMALLASRPLLVTSRPLLVPQRPLQKK